MSDIVERLREWSAADMDTHASLRRNGAQVAEVPWSRHGTDLAETVLDAAAEIERLRAEKRAIALQAIADQTQAQENWEEVQRLRAEVETLRSVLADEEAFSEDGRTRQHAKWALEKGGRP